MIIIAVTVGADMNILKSTFRSEVGLHEAWEFTSFDGFLNLFGALDCAHIMLIPPKFSTPLPQPKHPGHMQPPGHLHRNSGQVFRQHEGCRDPCCIRPQPTDDYMTEGQGMVAKSEALSRDWGCREIRPYSPCCRWLGYCLFLYLLIPATSNQPNLHTISPQLDTPINWVAIQSVEDTLPFSLPYVLLPFSPWLVSSSSIWYSCQCSFRSPFWWSQSWAESVPPGTCPLCDPPGEENWFSSSIGEQLSCGDWGCLTRHSQLNKERLYSPKAP